MAQISLVGEIDGAPVARRYDTSSADGPHPPAMGLVADAKGDLHATQRRAMRRGNNLDPAGRPKFPPWLTKLGLNHVRHRQLVNGLPFEIAFWVTSDLRMIDWPYKFYFWYGFRLPVLQFQAVKRI